MIKRILSNLYSSLLHILMLLLMVVGVMTVLAVVWHTFAVISYVH